MTQPASKAVRPHVTNVKLAGDAKRMAGGLPMVQFSPGVNILAGPNGSGKSTIIRVIRDADWEEKTGSETNRAGNRNVEWIAFDGEQDNPRFKVGHGPLQFVDTVGSHGQVQRRVFKFLNDRISSGMLVIMDEPEAALDLDGVYYLRKIVEERTDLQWIIASHHPVLWKIGGARIVEIHPGHVDRTMTLWRRAVCGS